jgi:NADPH:quinone reductase
MRRTNLDGVGGGIGLAAFGLLGAGGRFCPFGMASGSFAERLRALTQAALNEAAAGRIRPVIGQEFELSQAGEAHAAIEARTTTGKTLLTVSR